MLPPPLRLHLDPPRRVPVTGLVVRGTLRRRECVSIRLHDAEGRVGLGEAMPLPGYSRDNAAAAESALAAVAAATRDGGFEVDSAHARPAPDGDRAQSVEVAGTRGAAAQLDAALAPHASLLAASPGARFALECALLDLLARRQGTSAAAWLAAGRPLQRVALGLLLPDDADAALAAAAQAAAAGFTVIKLKVARADRPPAVEDALLAAIRDAADAARPGTAPPVGLRLDANGELAAAQVAGRFAAWRRFGVELVEEPVGGAALLGMPALPLPWAVDESLTDPVLTDALLALPAARRPAALVLKPAELGLTRCMRLAAAAAQRGIGVIVTHSLDGDLGHAAACALALGMPLPPRPCGLAPHAGLRRAAAATAWLPAPEGPGLGVDTSSCEG